MNLGFSIKKRRYDPELMDEPGVDPEERAEAYAILRRVNRQFFGGIPVLRRELTRWLAENPRPAGASVRILDVAGGSGDLAAEASEWLSRQGLNVTAFVVDLDPTALGLARGNGLRAFQANALKLPLAEEAFDLVIASKFAHHLDDDEVDALLRELARVSGSAVMVLDLARHGLAWGGFWLWSRVFTRNRLVRYDGPLSVLRGFLPEELETHARTVGDASWRWAVRRHPWFQLALVGRRQVS
ncbi:MAG TPA: methyltransferase domain-containing protein [Isosphaeraceae bacterium]|nr:methyltransferase domain-containing protein [Isosphaeraceae bacterium]